MINNLKENSIVQVLRIHNDVTGKPCASEYVYGRIDEINESYVDTPVLVEVILPTKKDESVSFYRFWTAEDSIKNSINPLVIEDSVNPFGY